jgi:lysine 2,3-aminomutase
MARTRGMQGSWEEILAESITSAEGMRPHFPVETESVEAVIDRYPMRINPYYLQLMKSGGEGICRQAMPDPREILDTRGDDDPLSEEDLSPVQGLTHKYPDRVLLLVSNRCAVYCRFCNRKRKVGRDSVVSPETIREGIAYIRGNREVRDVLLSGGDPLLQSDRFLFRILSELRAISHVEIIRIGTRTPCTLPQRITPELARLLGGFHPLYISTHFNHPQEVTPLSARACGRLADAGIPLGCQTVLLRGINDDAALMAELIRRLLTIRVRPYYLFQMDPVRGTSHFWTPVGDGLNLISALQKTVPALGLPQYVIDLPGGGGKVPLF